MKNPPSRAGWLLLPLLICLTLLGSSCSSSKTGQATAEAKPSAAFWRGDGVPGSPRMVIDLSEQRIRYYKGDQLVGVSPISSGRESHSTVTGQFRIIEKDIDHRSSLYGSYVDENGNEVMSDVDVRSDPRPPGTRFLGANMRYFMRVVGAIGMHEGYLPGYPASHGCIRLPSKMAAIFYHATPHGTPVKIVGNARLAAYEPDAALEVPSPASSEVSRKAKVPKSKSSRRQKTQRPPPGTTLYL